MIFILYFVIIQHLVIYFTPQIVLALAIGCSFSWLMHPLAYYHKCVWHFILFCLGSYFHGGSASVFQSLLQCLGGPSGARYPETP